MKACTIVARNYLAHARVLAHSYLAHNPGDSFHVLVLDDVRGEFQQHKDGAEVLGLDDIGLDHAEVLRMLGIYDVRELATAVKPWLLRTLRDRSGDVVVYLDPDIQVFGSLEEVVPLAAEHGIVLTPHSSAPMAHDTRIPNEPFIRQAGVFNLGFIAIGPGTDPFLDWWSERLGRDCVIDVERGLFVDQSWIDLVPCYFDHQILKDPGYNVAYWNLHTRKISRLGDRFMVDGRPLVFFHFSGFSPDAPYVLTKYAGDIPRVLLSENEVAWDLCENYGDSLCRQEFAELSAIPYGYDTLANGLKLDFRMRHIYRDAVIDAEARGTADPPNPYAAPAEFTAWLAEPAGRGLRREVTRYVLAAWKGRKDLQQAFPDLTGGDGKSLAQWATRDIGEEIPKELLIAPPLQVDATDDPLVEGVTVAGYFRAEQGLGEAARVIVATLDAAGLPCATFTYDQTGSRQTQAFAERGSKQGYDVNIVQVNADMFRFFANDVGPEFFAGRYTIGVWAWEVDYFPVELHPAFDLVDEVWAISRHAADAIAAASPKPVHAFPLPVSVPQNLKFTRADLGMPEGFVFLFICDLLSIAERKNPLGLVQAFMQAFADGEGPTLIIKTINGDRKVIELERLRHAVRGRSDIVIVDGYRTREEVFGMQALCDCYVSLHRSEGFGLTLAEAMALGRPVIATGYSGNLDFMNEDNSFLVPFRLVNVAKGCEPYPTVARWAEPDLMAAAALMRQVYEQPAEAQRRGARARTDMEAHHSPVARAAWVTERLAAIRKERKASKMNSKTKSTDAALSGDARERVAVLLSRGPDADSPTKRGGAYALGAKFMRRLVRRALRNQEVYQREVGQALVRAVAETEARMNESLKRERSAIEQQMRAVEAHLAATLESRNATLAARVDDTGLQIAGAQNALAEANNALAELATRTERWQRHLEATPYVADPSRIYTTDANGEPVLGYLAAPSAAGEGTYKLFEEIFRGSEAFIRGRQQRYVDLLRPHAPILDVGCGRGEMLDLLKAAGIDAIGIEIDAGMVARCREKGLEVRAGDGIEFLESKPDASIGAIFCAQVIEHLAYEQLMKFFSLARAKLKPGGLLIVETVNPHSIRALKTFWTDLSHRHPIFPETVVGLCRALGFAEALVIHPNGTGTYAEDQRDEGEYAVLART